MQKNSVNKVILVGNLGQDPESRFTLQGTAVTNLSVATNETWKNQNGESQDKTEWHRIVMYENGGNSREYMKKGQMVYVEGRLETNEWEDQNQVKRKQRKCDVIILRCLKKAMQSQETASNDQPSMNSDDDIPFLKIIQRFEKI